MKYSNDEVLDILELVQSGRRWGRGGTCGETAIAMNRLLFDGKGTLVGTANKYLWEKKGVFNGHIGLRVGNDLWDAGGVWEPDGPFVVPEEFLAWGQIDVDDNELPLDDEDSYEAVFLDNLSAEQVREMLPGIHCPDVYGDLRRAMDGIAWDEDIYVPRANPGRPKRRSSVSARNMRDLCVPLSEEEWGSVNRAVDVSDVGRESWSRAALLNAAAPWPNPRAGWTAQKDEALREMFAVGRSDEDIGLALGVSPGAVQRRRRAHGLKRVRRRALPVPQARLCIRLSGDELRTLKAAAKRRRVSDWARDVLLAQAEAVIEGQRELTELRRATGLRQRVANLGVLRRSLLR